MQAQRIKEILLPEKWFRFLFTTFFITISLGIFAQDWTYKVTGTVKKDEKKLEGAIVTLYKNGSQIQQTVTKNNGKFGFVLEPNNDYIVGFSAPGCITKKIEFNTQNVPAERGKYGFGDFIIEELSLFDVPDKLKQADLDECLGKPIALVSYSKQKEDFDYDLTYANKIGDCLKRLKKAQDDAKKNAQKTADSLANISQHQASIDNMYTTNIQQGDAYFKKSDFKNAKDSYNAALKIKPAEQYPKDQITLCDKGLNDLANQATKDKQYNDLIKQADDLFKQSSWQLARNLYVQAKDLKPGEVYPQNQITICDQKLKESGDLDQKYKDLMANADKTFATKMYTGAKTIYQQASQLKPNEPLPKSQIAECDRLIKEAAEQAYKDAITKADALFNASKWSDARAGYVDASGMKPTEQYPKDQIAKCDAKIKAEGDSKLKDQQYKDAIAKADALFKANNFFDAKTAYQGASTIKPDEQYPKDQIALCDAKIKGAENDKLYLTAIAKADGLFKSSDWTNAKSAYREALNYKPGEKYPTDQIALCDAKIKAGDVDKQYNDAITKADGLFKASDWANAKTAYQDALGIKPLEKYPPAQILLCDKKLKELENSAARDQQYKDAIAKADALFNAGSWADAKSAYKGASTIKPDEKYPPAQIAICDQKLLDLKNADALKLKEQQYQDAIAKADKLFNASDWANAKVAYQGASTIKPDEKYPPSQITICDQKLRDALDAKMKDQQYKDAIAKADLLFKAKNFSDAKTNYMNASTIKPSEQYPKDQIALCDAELKKQGDNKARDQQYADALKKADGLFKALDYVGAKDAYQGASNIKPDEKYPKDQIALCDAKIKAAGLDKQYQDALAKADALFKSSDWTNAKAGYNDALGFKPTEKYPKDQIALCDAKLKDLENSKLNDQKYQDAIAKADALFKSSDWANAKTNYQTASSIKPSEKYPKDQIALCDAELKKIEDAKSKDQQYKDAIAKADILFKAKNFSDAKTNYMNASTIKPSEQYPKDQIALCDAELKKIGDSQAKDQQYKDALAKADALFKQLNYVVAKDAYQSALNIKPEEKYPKDQIIICDSKIKSADLDKQYNAAITKADGFFKSADYTNAKGSYNDALGLKPNEKYPKDQIAICDKKIAEGDINAKYTDAIKRGDNNFKSTEYNTALEAYKEALTYKAKDKYATDQITLCNSKIAIEKQYKDALAKADNLFAAKDWLTAKNAYQDALKIKDDKYPKDQMAECDKQIALANQNQQNDQKYKDAIVRADKQRDIALKQTGPQAYKDARAIYSEALTYKTGDAYATGEIAKIDDKLKNLSDPTYINKMFADARDRGDKAFAKQDFYAARDAYKEALGYVAGNPWCTSQLALCEAKIKALELAQQTDQKYQIALTAGDNALAAGKFQDAINSYNDALGMKPNEKYPKDKIDECNLKLQEQENSKLKDKQWLNYLEVLKKADNLFDGRDFSKAKIIYNQARALEPSEQRPKDRIAQCDAMLSGNNVVVKDTTLIAKPENPTDRKKRYDFLKNKYGLGVTELTEVNQGNRKVLQRVVVTDSDADVYTRTAYNYGQTFYYKNDIPITADEFVQATGPQ